MMQKHYQVIVMRPASYLADYPEHSETLADLQYVFEHHDEHQLHWKTLRDMAIAELMEADAANWEDGDYPTTAKEFTILGVAVDGVYTPWMNGQFP